MLATSIQLQLETDIHLHIFFWIIFTTILHFIIIFKVWAEILSAAKLVKLVSSLTSVWAENLPYKMSTDIVIGQTLDLDTGQDVLDLGSNFVLNPRIDLKLENPCLSSSHIQPSNSASSSHNLHRPNEPPPEDAAADGAEDEENATEHQEVTVNGAESHHHISNVYPAQAEMP